MNAPEGRAAAGGAAPPSPPRPAAQGAIVAIDIPVYTFDIDFAGIVSNIVYLRWSEMWRIELLARLGLTVEAMVRTGIEWLRGQGATTIGLETMPRTVDNIGFYSRIGLVPSHLTVTLVHDVARRPMGEGNR